MSKRFVTFVVVAAIVFGLVGVSTAKATTISELEALIAQLRAEIAALQGSAAATPASTVFTKDLTLGSQGEQVEALQQYLIDEGYMDWDGALGYFGPITKAALAAWQADNGVSPAVGYWGPISRAAYAELNVVVEEEEEEEEAEEEETVTPGITTPGVEGSLTVSTNPIPGAGLTVREGVASKDILGLKLEAKLSDINVQRVKVDLGSSTIIYNKLFSKIYLKDGDTVLVESPLNSSTVVKESSTYYITLAGFNFIVPKDSTKVLTLAVDAMGSIDSTYDADATYGLLIPANGVRGVDGAGINQTGPSSALTRRTVTIDADALVDAATLKLAIAANTPVANNIIAADGSGDNEKDGAILAIFTATAAKDDIKITDATVTITKTGSGTATATTAYLYVDGETDPVGSATPNTSTGVATFSDIDYVVPADTTKTFTVKVDIRTADTTEAVLQVTSVNTTNENSSGTAITETGSIVGNAMSVYSEGPEFSLVSKSVKKSTISNSTQSTSTLEATFTLRVKAVGDSLYFGLPASATPMFATSTTFFGIYRGGSAVAALGVASDTSYQTPTGGITTGIGSNSFYVPENNEVLIPVTFWFTDRTVAGVKITKGSYTVGLEGLRWSSDAGATSETSDFMNGVVEWQTSGSSELMGE